jgi:hypothetical protein
VRQAVITNTLQRFRKTTKKLHAFRTARDYSTRFQNQNQAAGMTADGKEDLSR